MINKIRFISLLTFFYLLLSIKVTRGQNILEWKDIEYPSTSSWEFGKHPADLEPKPIIKIAKTSWGGYLAISSYHHFGVVYALRISGIVTVILEDGTRIKCTDRGMYETLNNTYTTLYKLTKMEIEKLKSSRISRIKFTYAGTFGGAHTAENSFFSEYSYYKTEVEITDLFNDSGEGRVEDSNGNEDNSSYSKAVSEPKHIAKSIIKMKKVNGVYQIPTIIDGIPMYFIFDTGASLISISVTEANFLYKQGKLTSEDIIGKANFTNAQGDISEGMVINLKTVKLGNRVLKNVRASVVNNLDAPLLMGQSALEKLGKFSIDYQKGEIVFE